LSGNNQTLMQKAEARFAERQKKTSDRMLATAEYESEAKARAVKTAKLRQLRLAREEVERSEQPSKPVKAKAQRAQRSVKGKTLFSRVLVKAAKP
jgi:hypothetical protein